MIIDKKYKYVESIDQIPKSAKEIIIETDEVKDKVRMNLYGDLLIN